MPWDLARLHADRVIVHEVPRRSAREGGDPPTLSEVDSRLTPVLRNYFREKIAVSINQAAYDAVFDPDTTSPVPDLIRPLLLQQGGDFVTASQRMAQHLYGCQGGISPPGLLVVVSGNIADDPCLAVLKLEKEEGVRVNRAERDGRQTFVIELVPDLMLTRATKVFKVGVFLRDGATARSIKAKVADQQRGYRPRTEVADFFLRRFLGCKLREEPNVATKRFFEASERFINREVEDPETKARYQIALMAELGNEEPDLNPHRFAQRAFAVRDRQRYVTYMAGEGVPAEPFPKDTHLIDAHLKRMQVDFESGLSILGKPEIFQERVRMEGREDGATHVEFEDRIRRFQGRA